MTAGEYIVIALMFGFQLALGVWLLTLPMSIFLKIVRRSITRK